MQDENLNSIDKMAYGAMMIGLSDLVMRILSSERHVMQFFACISRQAQESSITAMMCIFGERLLG
jgi:hypothetical protein